MAAMTSSGECISTGRISTPGDLSQPYNMEALTLLDVDMLQGTAACLCILTAINEALQQPSLLSPFLAATQSIKESCAHVLLSSSSLCC